MTASVDHFKDTFYESYPLRVKPTFEQENLFITTLSQPSLIITAHFLSLKILIALRLYYSQLKIHERFPQQKSFHYLIITKNSFLKPLYDFLTTSGALEKKHVTILTPRTPITTRMAAYKTFPCIITTPTILWRDYSHWHKFKDNVELVITSNLLPLISANYTKKLFSATGLPKIDVAFETYEPMRLKKETLLEYCQLFGIKKIVSHNLSPTITLPLTKYVLGLPHQYYRILNVIKTIYDEQVATLPPKLQIHTKNVKQLYTAFQIAKSNPEYQFAISKIHLLILLKQLTATLSLTALPDFSFLTDKLKKYSHMDSIKNLLNLIKVYSSVQHPKLAELYHLLSSLPQKCVNNRINCKIWLYVQKPTLFNSYSFLTSLLDSLHHYEVWYFSKNDKMLPLENFLGTSAKNLPSIPLIVSNTLPTLQMIEEYQISHVILYHVPPFYERILLEWKPFSSKFKHFQVYHLLIKNSFEDATYQKFYTQTKNLLDLIEELNYHLSRSDAVEQSPPYKPTPTKKGIKKTTEKITTNTTTVMPSETTQKVLELTDTLYNTPLPNLLQDKYHLATKIFSSHQQKESLPNLVPKSNIPCSFIIVDDTFFYFWNKYHLTPESLFSWFVQSYKIYAPFIVIYLSTDSFWKSLSTTFLREFQRVLHPFMDSVYMCKDYDDIAAIMHQITTKNVQIKDNFNGSPSFKSEHRRSLSQQFLTSILQLSKKDAETLCQTLPLNVLFNLPIRWLEKLPHVGEKRAQKLYYFSHFVQ